MTVQEAIKKVKAVNIKEQHDWPHDICEALTNQRIAGALEMKIEQLSNSYGYSDENFREEVIEFLEERINQ